MNPLTPAGERGRFRLRDHPLAVRAAAIGAAVAVSGCRTYERRPIDGAQLRAAWVARSPSDETAREFAARLGRAEGRGDVFDPGDGLSLAEAEPVALVFNRDLRLARRETGVARAGADHAGRWEDPVAGVDIERIVSGVPDPWVVGGVVELTIPISGRLAVERARAGAAYAAELRRLAAREWAVRGALRDQWVEWSARAHRARLEGELVERLRAVAEVAERQERAGVLSRVDARLFRVELAGAEADVIEAFAAAREAELRVRDLLGLAPGAPVTLIESVTYDAPAERSPGALEARNPELAASRAEYEVAEQSLRLEVRRQYPDLIVGPGYGIDEGDERVLFGLRLPIPLWNRNRQGVAEATARRDGAHARYESAYERLSGELSAAEAGYEAGRAVREALETRVVPLADEQDAEVRRVAELGRVDPLLLLQSIRSQHDARVRLVEARAAEAAAAIRLESLIGPVVSEPVEPPGSGGRP